ncbi:MAG TPA: hypothetical protein VNN17_02310, partial [Terriglobia bacterium]|nr:hypothetical protein [Terriglobia bacterium]
MGWKPIRSLPEFDHNRETAFPLRGMHQDVACARCHLKLEFHEVGSQCAECHADIHRQQFGDRCETCHTVLGWTEAVRQLRDHQNRFPLFGAHAAAACDSCHRGAAQGVFTGLDTQCSGCHLNEYHNTRMPEHPAAGFSTHCAQCHTADGWAGARFDHARMTNFPLTGAHLRASCNSCHAGGRYHGIQADCYGCHARDYEHAVHPNHAAAGFPRACVTCHSTLDWTAPSF